MTTTTIDPETVATWKARRDLHLKRQARQLMSASLIPVTCQCSATVPVFKACRCPECALYFCESCAREHIPGHITGRVSRHDLLVLERERDLGADLIRNL